MTFNSPAHEFPVAGRNSELSVFVNDFSATDGAHSHAMTNHPFEYVEIDRLMVGLGRYGSEWAKIVNVNDSTNEIKAEENEDIVTNICLASLSEYTRMLTNKSSAFTKKP